MQNNHLTIAELKQMTQAEKRAKETTGIRYGYLFHRELSIYITYVLVRFFPSVTPNMVSWAMIVVGLAGGAMTFSVEPSVVILGLVLVYLSLLLDKVDGEVARYTKRQSLQGVYLDEVYHALVPAVLLTCYFVQVVYGVGVWAVMVLVGIVFLSLFRRYERKWYMLISLKKEKALDANEITPRVTHTSLRVLMHALPLRLSSIVERFDVVVAALLCVSLLALFVEMDVSWYAFLVYAILSVVYTIRWLVLNYGGVLDERVIELREKGF